MKISPLRNMDQWLFKFLEEKTGYDKSNKNSHSMNVTVTIAGKMYVMVLWIIRFFSVCQDIRKWDT